MDSRRVLGAALIAVVGVVGCGGGDHPMGPENAGEAARSIAQFLGETLPAGASGTMVAGRNGRMVTCEGFGLANRERKVRAQCGTVYDIGSITKQFTAAAILKLQMMGRLKVSDPMANYLGPAPADKREITLHQLLTHTAGFVDALGGDYERLTRDGMLAAAFNSKLRSPPGAEFHYSNVDYSLLAAVIEKVSGLGYEEFLRRYLFSPAGMRHTGYVLPRWKPDQVAIEYDPRGGPHGRPYEHPWANDGPYWNLRGNGGLLSTARDMFRWDLALRGNEILDQRGKDELFKPYVREEPGGDTDYGYGWVIQQTGDGRVAWHNGGNGWSYAELTRLLDGGRWSSGSPIGTATRMPTGTSRKSTRR